MSDRPNFIDREFNKFMTFVGVENHNEKEQQIMRLAFFSGVRGCHSLIKDLLANDEPNDVVAAVWQAVERELAVFTRDLEERVKTQLAERDRNG